MSRPWLMSPSLACLLLLYVSCAGAAVRAPSDINISEEVYRDCSDLPSNSSSGVYMLQPSLEPPGVAAFCDMDRNGGGWTVVIRRNDTEYQDDFQQDWDSYKMGFGYLGGEFYWGNEYVWMLTSHLDRRYQVYFWLEDWDGNSRHAIYQNFWIEAEADHYRLHLGPYSGDAGDSFSYNNNQAFTTYDRDYDSWDKNCAESVNCAGGWWYNACTYCHLTGMYYEGGNSGYYDHGITWNGWKSSDPYSLKSAVMKIKPSDKA